MCWGCEGKKSTGQFRCTHGWSIEALTVVMLIVARMERRANFVLTETIFIEGCLTRCSEA